jgi:hypothetical protein
MAFWTLFAGADLFGEFDTREDAEHAFDQALEVNPSAADELAVFELDENGERVGEPITRSDGSGPDRSGRGGCGLRRWGEATKGLCLLAARSNREV